MLLTLFLFATGIFLGSCGALLFKIGVSKIDSFAPSFLWLWSFITNPYIFLGFLSYFFPAFIWIYLLSRYPVSLVQPILALTYAITPFLALTILKEPVPFLRWAGVVIIIFGVIVVAKS